MFFNYNLLIAISLGIFLYFAGRKIASKVNNKILRMFLITTFFLLSIPHFTFSGYYFYKGNIPLWYYEFRSINNIELLSVLSGLFFGFIDYNKNYNEFLKKFLRIKPFLFLFLILLLIPFIKPIILPIALVAEFNNEWNNDVCLQSSPSTCGPASLATIYKYYKIDKTEKEISRNVFSCMTGTENWYLCRYARKNNLRVKYLEITDLYKVPIPSIIGVKTVSGYGHFMALLGFEKSKIKIGDPLEGLLLLDKKEFDKKYKFMNFVMSFENNIK